jgi:hypothetical protein
VHATEQTAAEQTTGLTKITKEWLKPHSPCSDGYRWFLEKFPQGADFGEVYQALRTDKRYSDADWLASAAFKSLDTAGITNHTVAMAGADEAKIEAQVQADGANPEATATTGEGANAATTGYRANAATTGYRANAATTGEGANAATTGEGANAATTGEGANAATTGEGAVAAALGIDSKAKAVHGAIVCVHRNDRGALIAIRASKVGENGVKPDTWYSLTSEGEFVEVPE